LIHKKLTILCVILSISLLGCVDKASKEIPKVSKGVIDLREWKFQDSKPLEINGEWEFYWGQLIFPAEFYSSIINPVYREFPKLWKGDTIDNEYILPHGYATHRARVILNSVTPELSIAVPQFYSAYILFINGDYICSNGQVGVSEETSNPHWEIYTRNLKITSDTLDIVLQVSNFQHSRGGPLYPIKLGEKVKMQTIKMRNEANDFIMAASLFFVGLFFMVLFSFGRHEKSILYYSLFCLLYSYNAIGSGNYTFHSLFPDLPWLLTLKLEYITLFLASLSFSFYSYHLYKEETSKYFLMVVSVFCFGSVLITLFSPVNIFTTIITGYSVFAFISAIYIFSTYILAKARKREGSKLSLISSTLLFVMFGYMLLEYFGIVEKSLLLYFFGYQQFFFVQSIILFYRYNRKIEMAKENAEAAAKSQSDFLSMISHEIRTPLNAVIGLTNYLISDKPKTEHVDDLKTLKFSAEHLHVLINDVLDYSKLDAGKIEFEYIDTEIIELCRNIVKGQEPKAREKGVFLNFLYDESIPKYIVCDGLRMSQILTNLVGNAIKFTNEGGVTLSLKMVMLTKQRVSIKFIVEDSGIGIPKEKQVEIFDSFSQASTSTTREYGGTGLGLSITKRILNLQNTKINLFSIEGQGSRFYFTQTFQISIQQERVIETIDEDVNALEGKKILLVEDNPINVMVAKKFLSRWNIEVEVAENGQESLDKITEDNYDLVLMDLQMPIMDGYDASREIRKMNVHIPILALTASVMLDVGDKVYKSGMNDFITKPFDPNDLYTKIRNHIEKSESEKTEG